MRNELERDLTAALEGEVHFDAGARAMYAHDASNYRMPPIGVVIPRHADDVVATLRICRAHGAPVVSRGGGTSLAGQTVNHAVVLDFSKYMTRVLEIDAANRRVRVQPGCILDSLRDALKPYGLTYGPDPATHNRNTLGGMLGNNSCGIHSVMSEFYGPGARTSDQVLELDVVSYDGVRLRVGPTNDDELRRKVAEGGRVGQIYAALTALRDQHASQIRARFAPIPRRVSGYNLDELLPEKGFNVARALVGSEGTCVTILEATLTVIPAKAERALVVLGYPSVYEAGDHIPEIRSFKPVGLEGMDAELVEDMKRTHMHAHEIKLLPQGKGWLLVELGADTREEADAQAQQMMDALRAKPNPPEMKWFDDPEQTEKVWKTREAGLGATAFIPGRPDAWPGWEDSAVPPDRVGAYLRDFRDLMHRYGYRASLYGHFGQGCIHCRIDFDLDDASGIASYAQFTSEAADLVVKYGGSLSGEHGDGQSRGDLLERQFGRELVQAFREFKRIWDPDDRMNPGKIVDGLHRTQHLKLPVYNPPSLATHFQPQQDHRDFRHAAKRCVGIGMCRRHEGGVMCPSYMVTHAEKHSTRGRARLLFEMLQGDVIEDGWASEQVKDALDLCLACKGCKGDCPVHVDMATYKSEFLSHYYEHHLRPRHAYAFGWIHRWARVASIAPSLANFATQTPGLRRIAAAMGGMAPERPIPKFAPTPFTRAFKPRHRSGKPVVLWPDTFNNHFFPETLAAAVDVLGDAGFDVLLPAGPVCCGRALYDYGMLDLAERLWERNFRALARFPGVPVVGLEPSCVAAFREELPDLFPGRHIEALTLAELLERADYEPPHVHAHAIVHGHCHHKSVLDWGAEVRLLNRMRLEVSQPDPGCCGLAGSFGFEADHYDISMKIGERALLPAARNAPETALVLADGFSCREQIRHGAHRHAYHVAELISAALDEVRRTVKSGHEVTGRPAPADRPDAR